MRKLHSTLAIVLLSLALGASARQGVPIVDHPNVPVIVRSGAPTSAPIVRDAIIKALGAKGWTYAEPSPGLITGSLLVRGKHTIMVDIPYEATTYSLKYRDSINMNYERNGSVRPVPGPQAMPAPPSGPIIHPNYNVWVSQLKAEINAELLR